MTDKENNSNKEKRIVIIVGDALHKDIKDKLKRISKYKKTNMSEIGRNFLVKWVKQK